MKKIFILWMTLIFSLSYGCSKTDDSQDIQREEEMDQSDIVPSPAPANVNTSLELQRQEQVAEEENPYRTLGANDHEGMGMDE